MLNKKILQIMAEAERMMDEGKMPFVMAPGPSGIMERFAMTDSLMKEFGLRQGQSINTMIRDAIIEESVKNIASLVENLEIDSENSQLEKDFDFRNYMNEKDEDEDNATRH